MNLQCFLLHAFDVSLRRICFFFREQLKNEFLRKGAILNDFSCIQHTSNISEPAGFRNVWRNNAKQYLSFDKIRKSRSFNFVELPKSCFNLTKFHAFPEKVIRWLFSSQIAPLIPARRETQRYHPFISRNRCTESTFYILSPWNLWNFPSESPALKMFNVEKIYFWVAVFATF